MWSIIVIILSLWTTWAKAGSYFHAGLNQVARSSLSMTCKEVACLSQVDTALQCIFATMGCRGVWFTDEGSGGTRYGLCSCAVEFSHSATRLGNLTLDLFNSMHLSLRAVNASPASKPHHLPHWYQSQVLK